MSTVATVTAGHGEYIVTHPKGVSKEMYSVAYQILNRHSPIALHNAGQNPQHRYTLLHKEIKQLDPDLDITFIPRTLYELVLQRMGIEEDLKYNKICEYFIGGIGYKTIDTMQEQIERDCWHLCPQAPNKAAFLESVAFRLNGLFQSKPSGFTIKELFALTEYEIKFLKDLFNSRKALNDVAYGGPSTCFGQAETRGCAQSVAIQADYQANLFRNAVAFECSGIAQRCFLLYRGTPLANDCAYSITEPSSPFTVSYGTSLLAGVCRDIGGSAFYHMLHQPHAFALAMPYEKLRNSPFHYPSNSTLEQFYGKGESYVARSKAWEGADPEKLTIWGEENHERSHLTSPLSREELLEQFSHYNKQRMNLK